MQDSGWTSDVVNFPLIQGADVCGVVMAVGFAGDTARMGERVLIDPVQRLPASDLGPRAL